MTRPLAIAAAVGMLLVVAAGLVEGIVRAAAAASPVLGAALRQRDVLAAKVEAFGVAGYRPRPGMSFEYPNGTRALINAAASRGSVVPIPKPAGEYRVVLLGGSTAFGWGANDDETIAAHLERLLTAQSSTPVRVVSLAFDGYDSWQDRERFIAEGLAYAPDVVVVHSGINDVRNAPYNDIQDADPRTLLYADVLAQQRAAQAGRGPGAFTVAKHWSYALRLPGLVRDGLHRAPQDAARSALPVHGAFADYFSRNVQYVIERATAAGAEVLLSTPPSSLRSKYRPEDTAGISYWINDAATTQRLRDTLDQRLRALAAARSPAVRFAGSAVVPDRDFLDDCHLTASGNLRVAEHIMQVLLASRPASRPTAARP